MKQYIGYVWVVTVVVVAVCCMQGQKDGTQPPAKAFAGDYVTDGYAQRAEGYDWSVVSIEHSGDSTFHVSVRSRADIKKESCSFHADAVLSATGDTLVSRYEDAKIYFTLSSDTLAISSDMPNLLYFFCSGGGTLAGEYVRLHEKLDATQLAAGTE